MSETIPPPLPPVSVLMEIKEKVDVFLWRNWISVLESDGLNVMLLSRDRPRTTQRNIFIQYSGEVEVSVHCQDCKADVFVEKVAAPVVLQEDTINEFVDRVVSLVSAVRLMEVCAGVDVDRLESVWDGCPGGFIDRNPYRESRYLDTFRSNKCKYLVNAKTWRCTECSKLLGPLQRRLNFSKKENLHANTPNIYLTEEQKLEKMKEQQKKIDASRKKIKLLTVKVQELVKKEGVRLDSELDSDLTELLRSNELTSAQELFLHQQVKACNVKKKCGMRWHPTMIRLALSLHFTSPAAYDLLRESGMIKLPSQRTLYDYTHFKPIEEGIDHHIISSVAERVKKLGKVDQKYHVLMADEVYTSKNLVYQKSSGRLIGYTKLDEVDKEVRAMNEYLDSPDTYTSPKEEIVSKVLCYMIKGVSNGVKEVVACYGVSNVSAPQMYLWSWHVIGALERNGIRITAFVCDGSSINRAFINMHEPVTKLKSGIVIDTVNKAASVRILYFMSDVAHLLKTIRNCFYKSRSDKSKGKRCMKRKWKKIVWDFIIRLYLEDRNKTLRKSFKLSPVNVYPDSFTCMRVVDAAQVLSRTVASDLEMKNYPGVSETVKFIREVNDWFDRLNGAHSTMGKKRNNPNLNTYTSQEDPRFDQLLGFLDYLDEWKAEAYQLGDDVTINASVNETGMVDSIQGDSDVTFDPVEDNDEGPEAEDDTKAAQRILSHQTLLGIETTTRSFIACVKFLLGEGVNFVNARIFSQDPLEQYFSRQRAGGGGSNNPNLQKNLSKNRAIHIQGQLGIKKRKGNSGEAEDCHIEITEERLPKRKSVRPKKMTL